LGLVGIGYYVYMVNAEKPKAKRPPVATASALDKDKFIEFPLIKKEPYNHNTTK
jgi:cytochrome-b5 reductase